MNHSHNLYSLVKRDVNSGARAGLLHTSHGVIETPVFMPVGTRGTVKAVEQRELEELKFGIILGNTYHLYLRPNDEIINKFGGLHKFINWKGAILTDSGGYQVFSLQEMRKLTPDGVKFKSHIDGSTHYFTPESVVKIQRNLGSDFVMVLDECVPYPATEEYAAKSMQLSLDWARKAKEAFTKTEPLYGADQFLFGIAQGGMYKNLRKSYLEQMIDMDFDGNAIGGLSVGEPTEMMYELVDYSTAIMPENKPRYLMGVGTPQNLLECISMGIDMFDCVLPTRNARNGQLFTTQGKINIKNSKYKLSDDVIDPVIDSYASRNFSLGYLRHLFVADEILGLQLASMHNLAFYKWLMVQSRIHIMDGTFAEWKNTMLKQMDTSE